MFQLIPVVSNSSGFARIPLTQSFKIVFVARTKSKLVFSSFLFSRKAVFRPIILLNCIWFGVCSGDLFSCFGFLLGNSKRCVIFFSIFLVPIKQRDFEHAQIIGIYWKRCPKRRGSSSTPKSSPFAMRIFHYSILDF